MATKITVSKPEVMKSLRELIDNHGKRILKSKSPTMKSLLSGRIEGAIYALEFAGIVTDFDKTILKQYFENNYGEGRTDG